MLPLVRMCVRGPVKDCLFTLWNSEPWKPGQALSWDVSTTVRTRDLGHEVVLLWLERPPQIAPVPARPLTQEREATALLDNESVISLTKAGLGDQVIVKMIASRAGKYSRSVADVIKLKESGVSDIVIAAILNSSTTSTEAPLPFQTRIEANSRLFIAPMEANLDVFIAAEVVKQRLAFIIVVEEKDADYILTGLSQKTEVKWFDVLSGSVVGGRDRTEASARLVRVRDKSFAWAGESGDRSLLFSSLRRGGQRKLAERIVHKMKQDLF